MSYKKVLIKLTNFQGYKGFSSVVFYELESTNPKMICLPYEGQEKPNNENKTVQPKAVRKNIWKYYLKLMQ